MQHTKDRVPQRQRHMSVNIYANALMETPRNRGRQQDVQRWRHVDSKVYGRYISPNGERDTRYEIHMCNSEVASL